MLILLTPNSLLFPHLQPPIPHSQTQSHIHILIMPFSLSVFSLILKEVEAPIEEEVEDMVVAVAEDRGSNMIIISVDNIISHVHSPTQGHYPLIPLQAVNFHQT